MILLLTSRPDPASVTIRDRLLAREGWREGDLFMGRRVHAREPEAAGAPRLVLAETPLLHVEADGIDRLLAKALGESPDAILVLSKHRAASGKPSLTVHPVGNFGEAAVGGKAGELGIAAPALQSRLLRLLAEEASRARMKHEVTFEATHHGPLLSTPCAFVEIGSTEAEWSKAANGEVVARAILRLQDGPLTPPGPVLVGFGGGHYAPRQTDLSRRGACAFGHLVPAYALEAGLAPGMAEQAALKTPGVEGYFVDPRSATDERLSGVRDAFAGLGLREYAADELTGATARET